MNILRNLSPLTPSSAGTGRSQEEGDDVETTDDTEKAADEEGLDAEDQTTATESEDEESRRARELEQAERWERTLPGSGKLLLWWYYLVSALEKISFSHFPSSQTILMRLHCLICHCPLLIRIGSYDKHHNILIIPMKAVSYFDVVRKRYMSSFKWFVYPAFFPDKKYFVK